MFDIDVVGINEKVESLNHIIMLWLWFVAKEHPIFLVKLQNLCWWKRRQYSKDASKCTSTAYEVLSNTFYMFDIGGAGVIITIMNECRAF